MTIIYILAYLLFAIGVVVSGFLIYRYSRFSDWRQTEIGRAFMLMKVALFAILFYNLFAALVPFWVQVAAVFVLVTMVDVALVYQTRIIVKLQGGFRRRQPTTDEHAKL